ncbi:hypothetical protein [Morganella morganii IS15]|nr:hypothetical protein [Morganella morganii IS15]
MVSFIMRCSSAKRLVFAAFSSEIIRWYARPLGWCFSAAQ